MKLFVKIKEELQSSSFFRSVLTMVSGTVISQIILIAVSPVIARLYFPEDMGVLASFGAIVAILGRLSAGCYEQAIVLPKTDKESNAVSLAGFGFALSFGIIITIISAVFYNPLVSLLKLQGEAASWFYLLGVFVFLTGVELVLNRVAIRNRHFRVIASTRITQQISSNSIKIGYGFYKSGAFGLFFGTLFSLISRVVRLGFGEYKLVFSKENRPSWKDVKQSIIRYKKFPLISSWAGLLNVVSVQLPVVLFAALYSPAIAGYYALSHRILSLPMALVGQSISDAFLERAAREKENKKKLTLITVELYKKLLVMGAITMSFVTFYGDILFPLVFGENWMEAGRYAQWISIWIIFQLAISPLTQILNILERQGERLVWNILLCISRISFVFFMFLDDIVLIIAIYSIISSVFYIAYSIRILNLVKVRPSQIKNVWHVCIAIYLIQFLLYLII